MLFETLGASLLGNMLTGKGIVGAGYGHEKEIVRASYGHGEEIVRADYGNKMDF